MFDFQCLTGAPGVQGGASHQIPAFCLAATPSDESPAASLLPRPDTPLSRSGKKSDTTVGDQSEDGV